MMESLLHWDTALFHWINSDWGNPVFNVILPAIRNKFFWIPLYVLVISWVIFNHPVRQTLWIVFFLALSILASDTISSRLIKNQVQRLRPCHALFMEPPVIERVSCGSGFSFPSSHAANHFCMAAFMVSLFGKEMRRWKHWWWIWAGLISFAQVYVGVHYPLDILGGALLGLIVGTAMGHFCNQRLNIPSAAEKGKG